MTDAAVIRARLADLGVHEDADLVFAIYGYGSALKAHVQSTAVVFTPDGGYVPDPAYAKHQEQEDRLRAILAVLADAAEMEHAERPGALGWRD